MAAVFPTLGAVEHYIRPFNGDSPWQYLGTAVTSPEEEYEDFMLPLLSDLGGRSVPLDYVRDRRKCFVTTTLGRFNRTTMRSLRQETIAAPAVGNYTEGAVLNGVPAMAYSSFELLLVNAFVAGGTFTPSLDQPAGRCYYSAIPRKVKESRVGTRAVEVSVLFECIGVFNASARNFDVYTENANYWGVVTPE